MKNIRKKVLAFLAVLGCLIFCVSFSSKVHASWSPASEWEEDGFPVEDWTTDHGTYHKIGFINDPKNNQLLLYVNMNRSEWGNYKDLQPDGYNINIGNVTYSLILNNHHAPKGPSGATQIEIWDPKTYKDKIQHNACHYYTDKDGFQSAIITIPYNMFNRDDLNESTKITMSNPNLGGNKEIKISGASTGPYIPVIIAFVLASITVVGYYHKRKLVCHEHQ